MKPIFQTDHRHRPIRFAASTGQVSRKTDYNYQVATLDDFDGGCAGNYKAPFRVIGRDYFAREAHQHFATEAAAFFLLMMTTALPLFNGANAVVELIRSTGGAF